MIVYKGRDEDYDVSFNKIINVSMYDQYYQEIFMDYTSNSIRSAYG